MKIRTCFIMKFVYSHNVIMCWNNVKPRFVMLHFILAASTNDYSWKQDMSLPLTTTYLRRRSLLMKKRGRKNLFPEICVIKTDWCPSTPTSYTLLYSICKFHKFASARSIPSCEHQLLRAFSPIRKYILLVKKHTKYSPTPHMPHVHASP